MLPADPTRPHLVNPPLRRVAWHAGTSIVVGLVLLVLGLAIVAIMVGGALRLRAWRRRASTIVGVGDGPLVHVLPMWARFGQTMQAERGPVDGEAPWDG